MNKQLLTDWLLIGNHVRDLSFKARAAARFSRSLLFYFNVILLWNSFPFWVKFVGDNLGGATGLRVDAPGQLSDGRVAFSRGGLSFHLHAFTPAFLSPRAPSALPYNVQGVFLIVDVFSGTFPAASIRYSSFGDFFIHKPAEKCAPSVSDAV